MAIIYTYPTKASPAADDLILISDSADSNKTKQVKVSALPSSGAGITLTTTGTSGVATLTGSVLNIPNYATSSGLSIFDEGSGVGLNIDKLDFIGTGVSAVVDSNDNTKVNITVPGGSGTPGGNDTQIQYNNNGAFGGTTGLTWDDSNNILSIATRYEGDINGALLQQVIVKEVGGVSKGDIVYISGGTGDNPEVKKAQANASITMPALGIMKANTAENATGECVTSGEITGLGSLLTGISTGDELFVSSTTAGGFQTSAPTGEANLIQKIGKVIKGDTGGALTVLGAFRTNATPNLNQGSLFIGNASNQATTLGIGGNNTVLTSNGTTATWATAAGGAVTSYTNAGSNRILTSNGTGVINGESSLLYSGSILTLGTNSTFQGSRNNADNVQTTNGIIELSNSSTVAYAYQANLDSNSNTTGASRHIIFRYSGSEIGFIRNANTNTVIYSTSASDERKKKNIVEWDDKVLDSFSLIEPKKFNYLNENDSDELTKGFIAQQMVDKFPEAYPKDPDTVGEIGYYSFNPSGMTVYLMKAIKELKEEIDTLKSRISTLEG